MIDLGLKIDNQRVFYKEGYIFVGMPPQKYLPSELVFLFEDERLRIYQALCRHSLANVASTIYGL